MSQQTIEAMSLDDLADVVVEVAIPRPDGKQIRVKLRTLSGDEVWEVRRAIKWPKPPIKDYRKIGGEVTAIYDYENEEYVTAHEDASRELSYRHLIKSLQLDIPGETFEERYANLHQRLGQWALNALLKVSNKLHYPDANEVDAVASSFRAVGDGNLSGHE
jgi:hypothetical protein